MITNLHDCPSIEISEHMRLLQVTPVRGLVSLIQSGQFVLRKGMITSLRDLGSLPTEFGELGGITARQAFDQEKFLVRQVYSILKRAECTDKPSLRSIEHFMSLDATGQFSPVVTILRLGDQSVLKD